MYVNRLVKEFNEMQKMMKKLPGMMKNKHGFGGMNALKNLMRGMK